MIISDNESANSIFNKSYQTNLEKEANNKFDMMMHSKTSNTQEDEKNIENDPRYVQEQTTQEMLSNMEKLVKDIDSVMRTGLTEDEIELLEKMLENIKKEMDSKYPDEKSIKEMLSALEKAIAEIKKEISGEAIIEADDTKKKTNLIDSSSTIEERVEQAQKDIEKLKDFVASSSTGSTQTYQSSQLLEEITKFQGK